MTITRRNLFKLAGATAALAPLVGTAVLAKPSPFGPDEKVYYLSEIMEDIADMFGGNDYTSYVSTTWMLSSYCRNIVHANKLKNPDIRNVLVIDERYRHFDHTPVSIRYTFDKIIFVEPDTKRWKVVKDRMRVAPYYV